MTSDVIFQTLLFAYLSNLIMDIIIFRVPAKLLILPYQ